METELDADVRALLESSRGDWPRICERADVSHSWISKFVRGEITNPRFQTLKRIKDLLSDPQGLA